MSYFGGAGRPPSTTPRPPGRPDAKSIFPVGSRVLVIADSMENEVHLSDEPGHQRIGTVLVGTEVEITAWRPRGGWATRYRIRLDHAEEGWVDAVNLRGRPMPPPVRRDPIPAVDEKPSIARSKRARPSRS